MEKSPTSPEMTALVTITGFRAFPGVPDNPSQRLIEYLDSHPEMLAVPHRQDLLDVAYAGVDAALESLLAEAPAALVLTGFSRRASGLTLERCVTSAFAVDRPDCDGSVPEPCPGNPLLRSNAAVDFGALHSLLCHAGLPCSLSDDAGTYLCNFTYRRAMELIELKRLSTRTIFVHIPAIEGTPLATESVSAMTLEDIARGLAAVAGQLGSSPAE